MFYTMAKTKNKTNNDTQNLLAKNLILSNTNPGNVRRSCSTCGTRRVTFVKYPTISHERGKKDGTVTMTNGTCPR